MLDLNLELQKDLTASYWYDDSIVYCKNTHIHYFKQLFQTLKIIVIFSILDQLCAGLVL